MPSVAVVADRVRRAVVEVPDFPIPGILFRDITPVFADPELINDVIEAMCAPFAGTVARDVTDLHVTHVVGIESRGFLFGVPMAMALGVGFVPARKPGRLPRATVSERYALEYRDDGLHIHADALRPESRVLIVDDVLATGGTASAAERLVRQFGATVVGTSVLVELSALNGRALLTSPVISAIVTY